MMNKIKSTIVVLMSLLALSACAGSNNKGSKSNSRQPTSIKKEKSNMEVIHLTKAEFLKRVCNYEANPDEWKYEGTVPCIVDFYATWCGPCKMLSPILEELAKEYDGKIVVYKIDVDKEEELAAAFGVQSIPTLIWCPMKGNPTVTRGAMMKSDLKKMIDQTLLK
jgi:thioredoxin 1